jgi:two-component system, cell cycle response regulator
MTAARTFKVGVYGVKPMEVGMLDRAFRLSQFRPRVYRLLDGGEKLTEADMLIYEGGAPKVIGNIPLISITDKENPAADVYELERPLLPNRVLKVLDRVTVEVFDFAPELNIGNEVAAETGLYETLRQSGGDKAKGRVNAGGFSHLKVLVVDDSTLVQKQMDLILAGEGIHADFASDGANAVVMHRQKQYDLIFLDVMMPGLDGFQTCKALRKASLMSPHIIMLTSKGSAINRAHGVLVGANAYLTKPATRDSLVQTMERLLASDG